MKKPLVLAFLLTFCIFSFGQELPEKFKIYKTEVTLMNEVSWVGTIYSITDSTVILAATVNKEALKNGSYELIPFFIEDMQKIKIIRKRKVIRGTGIGFTTGLIAGGIYGYSLGDDNSPYGPYEHKDSQMYTYGLLFGFLGAGFGTIAGAIVPHRFFWIEGQKENFYKHREELNKFSIVKSTP